MRTPLLALLLAATLAPPAHSQETTRDIVVYGGTSGGVAAAVQARRLGKSVVLVEPTRRLGGLTTGGLGQTDIGNKAVVGGLAREFYERIARHYARPEAWRWQRREEYRDGGQTRTAAGEATMWTFEPSAALKVTEDMVREAGVEVVYGERLDRSSGVAKDGARITAVRMESGRTFRGRVFIDATYEGDLLAAAGTSFTVGREANATYGETLNGVQTRQATKHQLQLGIDPFLTKGDRSSGLLPGIDPTGPGREGERDHRIQAYCFRMCLTDHPENRIPFAKPDGYDERWYELLFRNFEAGEKRTPWLFSAMPNRKTDINNNHGASTDFIGQSYAYPESDYAERERIVARHLRYQQGLMWALANHPRVPEHVRTEVGRWGLCKDEFTDGGGWQRQLYVREARRLVGEVVMTQHYCQGREVAADPVGMAAYTMDSHNVQRYVDASGQVRNEGDVQVGGFPPYPISYRALTPKRSECSNLLVPVCLSASHIAYGSIRMEPVFMVLGQSAATAACHAIDERADVQAVDYPKLRARLLADKQVLAWTGPRRAVASLAGVVVDDDDATRTGFEATSAATGQYVGRGYRHDGNDSKGRQLARFTPELPTGGAYEVRLAYSAHANRASNVPVTVRHAGGETTVTVNQKQAPPLDKLTVSLGTFRFAAGRSGSVEVGNRATDGFVVIDAIQFLPTAAKK